VWAVDVEMARPVFFPTILLTTIEVCPVGSSTNLRGRPFSLRLSVRGMDTTAVFSASATLKGDDRPLFQREMGVGTVQILDGTFSDSARSETAGEVLLLLQFLRSETESVWTGTIVIESIVID
jgi:hypothetical protein